MGGKGYGGSFAPAPKLTAAQKRKQGIEEATEEFEYHKEVKRDLLEDMNAILEELPKRDYEKFKNATKREKDELLQQLRTVDYNKFQRLAAEERAVERKIRAAEKKLEKLKEAHGRRKVRKKK